MEPPSSGLRGRVTCRDRERSYCCHVCWYSIVMRSFWGCDAFRVHFWQRFLDDTDGAEWVAGWASLVVMVVDAIVSCWGSGIEMVDRRKSGGGEESRVVRMTR